MANVELTGNFLATARCLIFADSASGVWSFNPNTNTLTITAAGGGTAFANPSASVGLTVVDGSATTMMRSDAAPPLSQGITPTWTGLHTFGNGLTVSSGSTTISGHVLTLTATASVGGTNTGDQTLPVGANPSASIGLSAVNGVATTFMTSDSAPALSQAIAPTWTGQHKWTAPATSYAVIFSGDSGTTAFTGNTKMGVAVQGATAGTDYAGIDFPAQSGSGLAGRIAVIATGSGSLMLFGTSNNYSTGITNTALTIGLDGGLLLAAATGGDQGSGTLNATALYVQGAAVPAPVSNTFTGTLTGCTTSPTGACYYAIAGNVCTLFIAAVTGTSNTTAMTITGLPAACQPTRTQLLMPPLDSCENGGAVVGTISMEVSAASGTITFLLGNSTTGFGNTLVKGVATGFTVAYLLN